MTGLGTDLGRAPGRSSESHAAGEASAAAAMTSPPAVAAVVITNNPGPWFGEALEALKAQDYPNLATLVIDAASETDPFPVIGAHHPGAYVRRLNYNPGYAAATNRALRIVQGAPFLLLCHDDVAPGPTSVTAMVEQAYRMNAGIVTPKIVDWSQPDRLLALGGDADPSGAFFPMFEPGELDQGQYDVPTDTFVAPGGCMLVRADLMTAVGAFDAAMTCHGEDVDLSWRVQVAGGRIVTAPAARVRHLSAQEKGLRPAQPIIGGPAQSPGSASGVDDLDARYVDDVVLHRRNRLRTILKVRRRKSLLTSVLRLMLLSLGEICYATVTGRPGHGSAVAGAWWWNIVRLRDLRKLRKVVQRTRVVPESDINKRLIPLHLRLQVIARNEWIGRRARLHREENDRRTAGWLRNLPLVAWVTVLLVWILGSRKLLSGTFPAVGRFVPWPASPLGELRTYLGLDPLPVFGTSSLVSPSHMLAGLIDAVFLGAAGTLQRVVVLAMLPLGVLGMARLARPLHSVRARLLALLAYTAVVLPYDALGYGRFEVLAAYAAAPWMLLRLLRVHGFDPYTARSGTLRLQLRRARAPIDDELEALVLSDDGNFAGSAAGPERTDPSKSPSGPSMDPAEGIPDLNPLHHSRWSRVTYLIVHAVAPLALLFGLVGAFAPHFLLASAVGALGLIVGSLLSSRPTSSSTGPTSRTSGAMRLMFVFVGAVGVAAILLVPAIAEASGGWRSFIATLPMGVQATSFGELLVFSTGGQMAAIASAGILIAALPGLLTGRSWRLGLSTRLWFVTLFGVFAAWLTVDGHLGPLAPSPGVMLAPAAAAAALNVGVGTVSVQRDLRHHFGWQQLLPFLTFLGVLVALIPVASRAGAGTWDLPSISTAQSLSWMPDRRTLDVDPSTPSTFRVLWLGDPDGMPGGTRKVVGLFHKDLGAAVSVNSATSNSGPVLPSNGGAGERGLFNAVEVAARGDTVQLGRLIAPFSVRYVIVANQTGPTETGGLPVPPPPGLEEALASQLDLRAIESDPSYVLYENTAWLPVRAVPSDPAVLASRPVGSSEIPEVDGAGSRPVLAHRVGGRKWTGRVPAGEIFIGQARSGNWTLDVDGKRIAPHSAFGWAQSFTVPTAGNGVLEYHAPVGIVVAQSAIAGAWVVVAVTAYHFRYRRRTYL